jgi:3-methyladenine DNA glycosylase Tag
MLKFADIEKQVEAQHGDLDTVKGRVALVKSADELRATGDDRYLSELSKIIFQLGFNWKVIDNKWPAFETAFQHFELTHCAGLVDEQLEQLMQGGTIVKNWVKVKSVRGNARWLQQVASEHGSVGNFVASIQPGSYCEAVLAMQKQGERVGTKTAQMWLRRMGAEALILSDDVLNALQRNQVMTKAPSSKRDWQEFQDILDQWRDETGQTLNYLSQMLAFSTGPR